MCTCFVLEPNDILEKKSGALHKLIWSLMVHYGMESNLSSSSLTQEALFFNIKRSFLTWINCIITDIQITNLHSDWMDGRALSALVNYCSPNSIPDYSSLKPKDSHASTQNALNCANALGVPQLFDAEDITAQKPDERSLLLYTSQFIPHGKRVLLGWISAQVSVELQSLESVDGRILGALVNVVSKGKFESFAQMRSPDNLANIEQSMAAAEKLLGIRRTLTPEDYASASLSQVTRLGYLAQFYRIQLVGGAPALIPPAPEKVEIGPFHIPKTTQEGEQVWVELDCSDAGYGKLHAEVDAKETGHVSTVVKAVNEELGEFNRYHVLFTPTKVDIYKLSIFYADQHITGSPFLINLHPPDSTKVKHLDTIRPNQEYDDLSMTFDTSDAGLGKLKAEGSGEIGGAVPVKVKMEANGTYSVTFVPPLPDIYTIDVLWGRFSANAMGEHCGPVDLEVDQGEERECKVIFKPPVADVYVVDVNWDGQPIPGSPFTIDLLPPAKPEVVECTVPMYSVPGEEVELLVDASNAGSGELKAYCKGVKGDEIPTSVTNMGGRMYCLTFTPINFDLYELYVTYNNKQVPNSPFAIDMRPGVDPEVGEIAEAIVPSFSLAERCILKDLTYSVMVNSPITFTVDAQEAGQGTLKINAIVPKNVGEPEPTIQISERKNATFYIEYTPNVPGDHVFHVKWSGREIPSSPCTVAVVNKVERAYEEKPPTVDKNKEIEIPLGKTLRLMIKPKTNFQRNGILQAEVTGLLTGIGAAQIKQDNKGVFEVRFKATQPDHYTVVLKLNGDEVPSSPFYVHYYEVPIALQRPVEEVFEMNRVTEEVFTDFPLAEPEGMKFKLDVDEEAPGNLTAVCWGDIGGEIDVEIREMIKGSGKYMLKIHPEQPDLYHICVKNNDKEIKNSPFIVDLRKAKVEEVFEVETSLAEEAAPEVSTDASKCRIIDREDIPQLVDVGTVVALHVDTSKAGPGELRVTADKPATTDTLSALSVHPRPTENAVHEVGYTPASHGCHQLHFSWSGQTIPDSPVEVFAVDPQNIYTAGYGKEAGIEFENDGKLSNFSMKIVHKETGTILNGKLSKVRKGKFKVQFSPSIPGIYFLHLYAKKKELPQSPYIIRYHGPIKPQECKVTGLQESYLLGKDIKFLVDGKKAGDGVLVVKATGKDGKEILPVSLEDNKDGTHSVLLTAGSAGVQRIDVLWSDAPVPGSPFSLRVRDPSQEQLTSSLLSRNRLGTRHSLTFPTGDEAISITTDKATILSVHTVTEEQRAGRLEATAINSNSGEKVPVEVVKEMYGFEIIFSPSTASLYTIAATLNDEQVPNTPLAVEYRAAPPIASECKILGLEEAPMEYQVDKNIYFQVDTRLAGDGKVNIKAESPSGTPKLLAKASALENRIVDITYVPNVPGTHKLTISWSGVEIPRSPLSFEAKPVPLYPYGKPIAYNLELGDITESDLSCLFFQEESGVRLKGKVQKLQKNQYSFSFKPKEPGLYALWVYAKMREIRESPIYLLYSTPPKPENVLVQELPDEVYVMETTTFTIDTRNAGMADLKVKLSSPKSGRHGKLIVTDNKDGTYAVQHTPEITGKHNFAIVWDNKNIPQSPVRLTVGKRLPVIKHSFGPYTNIVPVGNTVPLDVVNVGKHEEVDFLKVTVQPKQSSSQDRPVIERHEHKSLVRFTPTVADDYILNAFLHNGGIDGSPFLIKAVESSVLSPDFDHPAGILPSDVESGKPTCLLIPRDDTMKVDELQATVIGPEGPCEVQISDQQESTYGLNFLPSLPGDYLVNVKKDGQDVTGPFKISAAKHETDVSGVFIPTASLNVLEQTIPVGTTVEVDIDTTKAGYGTLKANLSGEGKADLRMRDKGDGAYGCSITPTAVGVCQMDIAMNDKSIRGSPFTLQFVPSPPRADMCILKDLTDYTTVNNSITFTVDAREAGQGDLQVNVSTPQQMRDEPQPTVTITDNKDATFAVEYTPNVPGEHVFDVKWSGEEIPNNPFRVPVLDELAPLEPGLIEEFVETVNTYAVESAAPTDETDDAYSQEGTPVEESFGEVVLPPVHAVHPDIPIDDEGTPPVEDSFHVQMLTDEPFVMPDFPMGKNARMELDLPDETPGDVTAVCRGDISGEIPVEVSAVAGSTKYELKIKPAQPDLYRVYFSNDGKEVTGSPFIVDLRSKVSTKPDPSKCKIIGREDIPQLVDSGTLIQLQVDASEAGPGELRVTTDKPAETNIVNVHRRIAENAMYDINYTPTSLGYHQLHFLWNDENIPDSPVQVCTANLPSVRTIEYGKDAGIDFENEGKPSDFDIKIVHMETGTLLKGKLSKVRKGKFKVTCNPTLPGIYFLHIYAKKKEITQSPFVFRYHGPIKPQECKVTGLQESYLLGEDIKFLVDGKKAGDGVLVVKATGKDGKEILPVNLEDNKDGTHSVLLTAGSAGVQRIDVLWSDAPVPGSPFSLRVRDPSQEQLTSSLFSRNRVGIREPIAFPVQDEVLPITIDKATVLAVHTMTEEFRTGQLEAVAINANTGENVPVEATNVSDGFEITFSPSAAGLYTIAATLNDEQVPNTPLAVEYRAPPPIASECKIIGLEEKDLMFHQVDKSIYFQVDTRLAGDGKVKIKAESPRGKPKLEAKPNATEDHVIDVRYVPNVPGTHTLNISWSGEEIPKSPLVFDVKPVPRYHHGKPMEYDMELGDVTEKDLSCLFFQEASGARFKGKIQKLEKNKYGFTFKPKEPGLYSLWVYVKMREIKRSPIFLYYSSPPQAESVLVQELPSEAFIKEITRFLVNAKNAGMSELKVKVTPPKKGKDGKLTVSDNGDGTYAIQHVPDVTGKHSFAITWDKKGIPQSPVRLTVGKRLPVIKHSFGPYTNIVPVGNTVPLDVVNVGKHEEVDFLKVTVQPKQSSSQDRPVIERHEHKSLVRFTPTVADDYILNALLHNGGIDGSPFLIKAVESSVLSPDFDHPAEILPSDVESGKPTCLLIPRDDTMKVDELQATVIGPEGPCEVQINDQQESTYGLNFLPSLPGDYLVNVKKDGQDVTGPFKISAAKHETDVSGVFIPTTSLNVLEQTIPVGTTVEVDIDTTKAGYGTLKANLSGEGKADLRMRDKGDGAYGCSITPTAVGACQMDIAMNDKSIRGSPFTLQFVPSPPRADMCILKDLTDYTTVNNPITFTVDAREAGQGDLQVNVLVPSQRRDEPQPTLTITDNKDATFFVEYTPNVPGDHVFDVKWSGDEIPNNPFRASVAEEIPGIIEEVMQMEPTNFVHEAPTHLVEQEPQKRDEIRIQIGRRLNLKIKPKTDEQKNGRLDVRVDGEETGVGVADINQGDDGVFLVKFNPSEPDHYKIAVELNGEEVKLSPFLVHYYQALEPRSEIVTEHFEEIQLTRDDLEPAREEVKIPIGKTVKVKIVPKTPEQKQGKVESSVTGMNTGEGEVDISQRDDGVFFVKFNPTEPDHYVITTTLDGEEVSMSPLYVHYYLAPGGRVDESPVREVPTGIPVQERFDLDILSPPQSFLDDLLPLDEGEHSPVEESFHMQLSSDEPFVMPDFPMGKNACMELDLPDKTPGDVTAVCRGDVSGEIPVVVSTIAGSTKHELMIRPTQPDMYRVYFSIDRKEVAGSPFVVDLRSTKPDPTKCRIRGKEGIPQLVDIGTTVPLIVDASEAGTGKLRVTTDKPTDADTLSTLNIHSKPTENAVYEVDYTPASHGYHQLNFLWNEATIPDSPVRVCAVDPQNVHTAEYGKEVGMNIDVDRKQGDLSIKIVHGETGTLVDGKLSKIRKGKFKVQFSPTIPGVYFLHIYAKKKEIPQSPYIIKYHRPIKPQECKVTGLQESYLLGEDIKFLVDGKKAGDGVLMVKATGQDGKEILPVNLEDNKDGTHSVLLTAGSAGRHSIDVFWSDVPVPGSPFLIGVSEPLREQITSKLHSKNRLGIRESIPFPVGDEVLSTTTDKATILTVYTSTEEQRTGRLEATAINTNTGKKVPTEVRQYQEKGEFEVFFDPSRAGLYTVSATLNDVRVPSTPLAIEYISPPPIASGCKILGLEEEPMVHQVDRNICFQVDIRLAGDGKINIKAESPSGRPKLEAKKSASDQRIVDVTYVPNVPGKHALKVSWSGVEIPQSPIIFEVEAIPQYPIGQAVEHPLELGDVVESDLSCLFFQEESGVRMEGRINKLAGNKYSFSFHPKEEGLYSLWVYEKKREIRQSPIYLLYTSPPRPEKVFVREIPDEIYRQEPLMFTVDAKDAGTSVLNVTATSPRKGSDGELTVTDNKDGTYGVEHVPQLPGPHYFNITWDKKNIPQSPVRLTVGERVPVTKHSFGPYTNIVPVGNTVPLDVVNVGKHEEVDFLKVTVQPKQSSSQDRPVIERHEHKSLVRFTPTVADDYILNVLLNEEGIDGSPFLIKAVESSVLSPDFDHPAEILPSDVESGKPTCLLIPRDDTMKVNELQVSVSGPEGPCRIRINDQQESTYGLNFLPSLPGDYLVSVKKGGQDVTSPFKIHAAISEADVSSIVIPETSLNVLEQTIPVGTTVEVDIDTTKAGYGTLKANLSGEGKADLRMRDKGDGAYGCSITPTAVGVCQMDIAMNDKSIRGSPFTLQFVPSPPRADMCILKDLTDCTTVNNPITFTVDAREAGQGDLQVDVSVPSQRRDEPQPTLTITDSKDATFFVEYFPNVPGKHVFDVKWSGEEIPNNPFTVPVLDELAPVFLEEELMPAPVEEVFLETIQTNTESAPPEVSEPKETKLHVGTALLLYVTPFTTEQREGNLEVQVTGQETGRGKVDISQDTDGVFTVEFDPSHPDHYMIDVELNGEAVSSCPLHVDYYPAPSDYEPPRTETYHLMPRFMLTDTDIDLSNEEPGELTAVCRGDVTGKIEVEILETSEGSRKYKLRINPKEEDLYRIYVKFNDKEIKNSPFIVNLKKLVAAATFKPISDVIPDPLKCRIIGKEDIPEKVDVGSLVSVLVDASEAGPGELAVTANRPTEIGHPSALNVRLKSAEKAIYEVDYIPKSHGYHQLNFMWFDETIPGSPLAVRAIDVHNAISCEFGKDAGVEFDTDTKPSELSCVIVHKGTDTRPKGKISKVRKGKFKINFRPTIPGIYYVHVYANKKEISQSPYVVKYCGPIKPHECKVVGLQKNYLLGEDIKFQVNAKEGGDGVLVVKVIGQDGKEMLPVNVQDNKDGTYSVLLAAGSAGMHRIDVFWSDMPIFDSPFPFNVRDPSKEQLTSVLHSRNRVGTRQPLAFPTGDEALSTTTDKATILTVCTSTEEQRTGRLEATAINTNTGEKVPIEVVQEKDDFEVIFSPSAGLYTITATLNDEQVPNTPLAVEYRAPPPIASECRIIGLEKEDQMVHQVDKTIYFQVDTRLAGNGKVKIKAESPRGQPKLEAKPNATEDHIIDVSYVPNAPGTHILNITWSGVEVPKSPLVFEVESVPRYQYGKPIEHDLELGDVVESDLSCLFFQEETGTRFKGKIHKLAKNKYGFAFKPKEPGLYSLWVYVKMREIRRSPIYLYYSPPPKPEAVVICDLPKDVYVHEPARFTVDTRKAGMSQLKVKVAPPKRGKDGELKVVDNTDGTFTVQHTPEVTGKHSFAIVWDKKIIPQSPVRFTVGKRVHSVNHCFGPYTNIVPVDRTVPLEVLNVGKQEESDLFKVTVQPAKPDNQNTPVIEREEEKFLIKFTPTAADDYVLNVILHGSEIEGSPFLVKAVEREVLSPQFNHPAEILPSDVESGKPTCVLIPRDETLNTDEIEATAMGPEGPCTVAVNSELENAIGLSFLPEVPGDYLVNVKANGQDVDTVKVTAAKHEVDASCAFVHAASLHKLEETILVGTTAEVDIDTTKAGNGTLKANLSGEGKADLRLRNKGNGVYACSISPTAVGSCEMDVTMNDKSIRGSPFTLHFVPNPPKADMCILKDLTDYATVNNPITFTVDAREAGQGDLQVDVSVPSRKQDEPQPTLAITDNKHSTFFVEYTPNVPGDHVFDVKWSGEEIPNNPFKVPVEDFTANLDLMEDFMSDFFPAKPDEPPGVIETQRPVEAEPLFVIEATDLVETEPPLVTEICPAEPEPPFVIEEDVRQVETEPPSSVVETETLPPATLSEVLDLGKEEPGELTAHCHGEVSGETPVEILEIGEGTRKYNVKIHPKIPDLYYVHVKRNDEELKRSPFTVDLRKPNVEEEVAEPQQAAAVTDPSKCRIIGREDIPRVVDVGTVISVSVDASEAGPGELRVAADKPAKTDTLSTLNIHPRPTENAVHEVQYTPASLGNHKLNFLWSEETIPGSPVEVFAVDPQKMCFWKDGEIDIESDTKQSDLSIKIIHMETRTILNGKLSKVRKGKFKVACSPTLPGFYFLHVYGKKKEIPQSPFVFKYSRPTKPSECEVTDLRESYLLGEDIKFLVNAKEAGDGNLVVKIVELQKEEIAAADVEDNQDGTHTVTFKPETAGPYKIAALWSGQHIPLSPFLVRVRDPDTEKLDSTLHSRNRVGTKQPLAFPTGDEALSITTDKATILTVHTVAEEQRTGRLEATAINSNTGEKAPIEVVQEKDDFEVIFSPSAGLYTITATLNDEQVPNTPLAVEYRAPPPIASECRIIGLEEVDKMVHQVDKTIYFQVDTRLAGDGKVKIKAESPRGQPKLEAKPSATEDHIIDVRYVPNAPGTHTLNISWSGVEIPKSPLVFDVEPVPRYHHGKPIEYDLELGDVSEKDLSCLFFQEASGARFKGKLQKLEKNKYSFTFKPKEPGLYSLWVYVKMREIKRSPIYLFYCSPPKPEAVVVRDKPDDVYVLEPTRFTVDTKNAGLSQLKVKVTPPRRGKDGELTVTDNKEGTYTVQYVPKVTGTHSFAISWDKKSIPDSPLKFKVKRKEGIDYNRLSIASETSEQSLLDTATVNASTLVERSQYVMPNVLNIPEQAIPLGCPVSVEIDAKYSDAGTLKINQSGTGHADVQLQDKGEGLFGCTITPTVTGTCKFDIAMNGQSISRSPFTLDFCGIAGVALEGERLQVGVVHNFDINCAQLREGNLEVSCGNADAANITASFDSDKKVYNCSVCPKQAGTNIISVKYNGYHITGSPFNVNFTQQSSSNLIFSLVAPTGMDTSDVSANLETRDHQQIPLQLNELSAGQFSLDFVPTQGSEFLLTIQCLVTMKQKEVELAGGLFTLSYTTESMFATKEGEGLVISGQVGAWSSFTVEAEEGSKFGELSAVFDDEDAISSDPIITPIIPSLKYEVKYLVKKSGNFKIFLTSNGKPTAGSPYNIVCSLPDGTASVEDSSHFTTSTTTRVTSQQRQLQLSFNSETSTSPKPENVKVHGSGLADGTVGETQIFTIDTEGAGDGTIEMNFTGPEGFKVDLERDPDHERLLLASYTPQDVGTYTFEILWGGEPVPGSPFTVNIN